MNVLFLSQIVPYPPHGGVLQRGFNLLRELGRHARIHLLAFVHPEVLPTAAAREESRRKLLEFCDTVEYFDLWPKASRAHFAGALGAALCSADPFSVIAHRSQAFKDRVADHVRSSTVDLIHVDTIALAPFVPAGSGVPAVLTHHNIESVLLARRASVESRQAAKWYLQREAAKLRAYEAAVSPAFDVNILMSPQDELTLLEMAPGVRTAVVPNGVDVDYFRPDRSAETPALIYTGGMNMFANRDAVLYFLKEIWPRITSENPTVRFYAVGQDPPRQLTALAAADPRIEVTGYVDDIRPFVRKAAVYVVPLRVGGGTRLKVLDAMASGKAIVSTAIGCEGIDARAGEHLVIADTPDTFARATLRLLASAEQRAVLGDAARRFVVGRYSWRTIADRLVDAYGLTLTAPEVPA
jgi:sugar transferase (PEP-CTERM/EpsH1 system associated)